MSPLNPKKNTPNGKSKAKKQTVAQMVGPLERPEERDVKKKEAYVAFIHWTICTKAERKSQKLPSTQGEFAKKWDVLDCTLSEWKKRADFETLRGEMFRKKLAAEVPEVMADMRKRIKKIGKADEVELWLAYAEGWDKKKVLEIKPPLEFGDNDIRTMIALLPPEKQKEYYVTLAKLLSEAQAAHDATDGL